jgi:raffinose/stachyose/melibiose transport system permease protein
MMTHRASPQKRRGRRIGVLCIEILLVGVGVVYLYPFILMLFTSLKNVGEVINNPTGLPRRIELLNYVQAWRGMRFASALLSSCTLTVGAVTAIVVLASFAAYPLARISSKASQFLYLAFIGGMFIPIHTGVVPLVRFLKSMRLGNSHLGLILVYSAMLIPFAVFVYTGFLKSIPKEVEESALIDGCHEFTLFWRIVFPLAKPATASVVIICSMWVWNDLFLPLILLVDRWKKPLSPSVLSFFEQFNTHWNYAFAGLVMAMLPIIVLFLVLQKQYIKGLVMGAVKG